MGIRGLTTYVDANPRLLKRHQLRNATLVIDGNSILYQVHSWVHSDERLGANYVTYYGKLRKFFQNFCDCNVSLYIIFDGGYHKLTKKWRETLRRSRDRIKAGALVDGKQKKQEKVLPALAFEVLTQVLHELNIPYLRCDEEADEELVSLANEFDCPILSQDSDFFIYDVRKGYIPLSHLDREVRTDAEGNYLNCRLFHIDDFVEHFNGIKKQYLPLFASLIGNDVTKDEDFSRFFAQVSLPRNKKVSGRKIRGLLEWFNYAEDEESALEDILKFFKKEDRENLRSMISKSTRMYTERREGLAALFRGNDLNAPIVSSLERTLDGATIPTWFLDEMRKARIPNIIVNALCHRKLVLLCQVEDHRSPSSYQCSLSVRSVCYGVLFQSIRDREKAIAVMEYTRKTHDLFKSNVEPIYVLDKFGAVPSLDGIPELDVQRRRELLLESCFCDHRAVDGVVPDLQLLVLSLRYWKHQSECASDDNISVVLIVLVFFALNAFRKSSDAATDPTGTLVWSQLTIEDVVRFRSTETDAAYEAIRKYYIRISSDRPKNVDSRIPHAFSEWQGCLVHIFFLNRLLLCPIMDKIPIYLFNGPLAYLICSEMRKKKDKQLFTSNLLGGQNSLIYQFYSYLLAAATSPAFTCESGSFVVPPTPTLISAEEEIASIHSEDADDVVDSFRALSCSGDS